MSYWKQHQLMKPVLERARALDIATNPDPLAILRSRQQGLSSLVYARKIIHKVGTVSLWILGTFSKPCEYVGKRSLDMAKRRDCGIGT